MHTHTHKHMHGHWLCVHRTVRNQLSALLINYFKRPLDANSHVLHFVECAAQEHLVTII